MQGLEDVEVVDDELRAEHAEIARGAIADVAMSLHDPYTQMLRRATAHPLDRALDRANVGIARIVDHDH